MKPSFRLVGALLTPCALSCLNAGATPSWPSCRALAPEESVDAGTASESHDVPTLPVCIASKAWSAGSLGETILYHAKRVGRRLEVGYFVYWTSERPWGYNALSYAVLPAVFIDAFYSHLFFLFPGAQRFIHGPGDVEGARVTYELGDDETWHPVSAFADDGLHEEVALSPDEFIDDRGRVVLMTNVWSHQLGAKGAKSFAEGQRDETACFVGKAIAPLTDEIARAFRLGSRSEPRRARPAWRLEDHAPTRVAAK